MYGACPKWVVLKRLFPLFFIFALYNPLKQKIIIIKNIIMVGSLSPRALERDLKVSNQNGSVHFFKGYIHRGLPTSEASTKA
jgi:hypothetical protein